MKRLALAAAALVLGLTPALGATAPKAMSDDDFFLDRRSLIGTEVSVTGHISVTGDITFLRLADESNATFIQTDTLPREIRKALRDRCKAQCDAVVTGKTAVIQSVFGPDVGIIADSIEIR